MYNKKSRASLNNIHFISLNDLVPEKHLVRAIEAAIDFNFIYTAVEGLYPEEKWGKPGIDPVSLIKIVMIQYMFSIPSMRQTIREIEVNNAYRWFIGYDLGEPIPHFSTFSKNYTRRFEGTDIFEKIFAHILNQAAANGFLDSRAIFIDGTHIKANANKKKNRKVEVTVPAKKYQQQLEAEIQSDRLAHNKKPLPPKDPNDPPPTRVVTTSTTDPESGLFVKGEHERQFAYTANVACDRNNFILGFAVNPGNTHDSTAFDDLYAKISAEYPDIETVAVDAGYKTPWIMKQIIDDGKVPAVPYKRPMTPRGFFKKHEYVYDEYYDCYHCPAGSILKYSTTNREGYREYKSDPIQCRNCAFLTSCTHSCKCQKTITRHVWEPYMELAEEYRHTYKYRDIYRMRQETIERVFADAKERHGMRYTRLRGLQKVRMQLALTFACMNLKKLAKWKKSGPRTGLLRSVGVRSVLFDNLHRYRSWVSPGASALLLIV